MMRPGAQAINGIALVAVFLVVSMFVVGLRDEPQAMQSPEIEQDAMISDLYQQIQRINAEIEGLKR